MAANRRLSKSKITKRDALGNHFVVSLYVSILVIDAQSEMTVIFPNNWSASEDAALIEANQKRLIPMAEDNFKLTIGEPLGFSEVLIVASATPLRNLLKALQQIAKSRGFANRSAPVSVNDEFLDITNSLLDDLDIGTHGDTNSEGITLNSEVRGIDTKKLAAFVFNIRDNLNSITELNSVIIQNCGIRFQSLRYCLSSPSNQNPSALD